MCVLLVTVQTVLLAWDKVVLVCHSGSILQWAPPTKAGMGQGIAEPALLLRLPHPDTGLRLPYLGTRPKPASTRSELQSRSEDKLLEKLGGLSSRRDCSSEKVKSGRSRLQDTHLAHNRDKPIFWPALMFFVFLPSEKRPPWCGGYPPLYLESRWSDLLFFFFLSLVMRF